MGEPKIATRLFVEETLGEGIPLGLDADRAHFLRSVLRLAPGAHLAVFNGRDGEWLARLEGLGKGWASILPVERRRPALLEPDIWLVFAPIKRARIDFIAEKATELGCSRLQPVITARTAVERVNLSRLAANAREAAEQSERLTVPEVSEPRPLFDLLSDWPADRRLLMADEGGEAPAIRDVLTDANLGETARNQAWALLTGPEGGFAPEERERLAALPFVLRSRLGPRIMRADTAVVAGLAVLQALVGDWR